MATETVGARLVLQGKGAFIGGADEATSSVKALNEQLAAMADLARTAGGEMAGLAGKSDIATVGVAAGGTAMEQQIASIKDMDKAWAASGAMSIEQQRNIEKQTIAMGAGATATKKYGGALESLATSSAVKKLSLYGGLGIAGAAYVGIKQYQQVQSAITQVSATAGIAASRLPALTSGIIGLSKTYGYGITDLADVLYRMASVSSGLHATNKELIAMTSAAAQFGVLGNMPGSMLETTSRVIGALTQAGLKGPNGQLLSMKNPTAVTALLNAAVGAGDVRPENLITMLGRGGLQAAKITGTSATDMLSWMDLMTTLGANPSQVGTLTSHAIQAFASPTPQGAKVQAMLGIQPTELASLIRGPGGVSAAFGQLLKSARSFNPLSYYPATGGQSAGAQSALYQLQQWLMLKPTQIQQWMQGKLTPSNMSEVVNALNVKMFGGARGSLPEATILAEYPRLGGIEKQIDAVANPVAYAHSLQLMMKTPGRQQQVMTAQLKALEYQMGKFASPIWLKILQGITTIANWFTKHPQLAKDIAIALGVLIGGSTLIRTLNGIAKFLYPMNSFLFKAFGKEVPTWLSGGPAVGELQMKAAQLQWTSAQRNAEAAGVETGAADKQIAGADTNLASGGKFALASKALTVAAAGFIAYEATQHFLGSQKHPSAFGRFVQRFATNFHKDYEKVLRDPTQWSGTTAFTNALKAQLGTGKYQGYVFGQGGYFSPGDRTEHSWANAPAGVSSEYATLLQNQQNSMRIQIQHLKNIDSSSKTSNANQTKNQQTIQDLQTEIQRLSAAITAFANKPLTVSTTTMAQGAQKGNASQFARGVGGGPKPG